MINPRAVQSIIICVLMGWVSLVKPCYGQTKGIYQAVSSMRSVNPYDTLAVESWANRYFFDQLPSSTSLRVTDMRSSLGGTYITLSHQYNGISIEASGVKLMYDKQNQLQFLMNYLQEVEHIDDLVSKRSNETILPPSSYYYHKFTDYTPEGKYDTETVYYVEGSRIKPVFRITVQDESTGISEVIWVDYQKDSVLKRIDRVMYMHTAARDTPALGRVFIPDPCTRGKVRYGEKFEDNNDQHAPIFDKLMDTVVLQDVTFDGDTFRLQGPYVEVVDIAPRRLAPATSTDGTFFFDRDESGFEDVMVYYHIDSYQRYVQSLGFMNLQNQPIRVDSHGLGFSDQSQFVPDGAASYIRFGDGGVDDAEDADVIIHEYAHALSYAASGNDKMSCERRGLDEGYADYFAASYSRDIDEFDWQNIFNWDGHNPFHSGRMVVSHTRYPLATCSKIANVNAWGEIWASVLMRIRNEIGGEVADRIALEALYGNTNETTFIDAARLVLAADSVLYDGKHKEAIAFHFCNQGILEGANCLSVSNQEDILSKEAGDGLLIRQDGTGAWIFTWEGALRNESGRLEILSLMGQKIAGHEDLLTNSWEKRVILPRGLYVYRLVYQGDILEIGKIFVSKP